MTPDSHPAPLESRLAAWVLDHHIAQRLPHHAVELLRAIERGAADVDPADARLLLRLGLQAVITAEVLAGREVGR